MFIDVEAGRKRGVFVQATPFVIDACISNGQNVTVGGFQGVHGSDGCTLINWRSGGCKYV